MPRQLLNPPHSKSSQGGFTLIEVLVVLIITGLISGILFQALERAYRLQERFGVEIFSAQQGQMAADWYRQTVQGLHPDHADGPHIFRGNEHEFSGLSSNPLSNEYGAPTPITWRIDRDRRSGDTQLIYREGQQETVISSWHGRDARFVYVDEQQTAHDSWPPAFGSPPQLPKQIRLVAHDAGDTLNIVATPMGPATPLLRLQDL